VTNITSTHFYIRNSNLVYLPTLPNLIMNGYNVSDNSMDHKYQSLRAKHKHLFKTKLSDLKSTNKFKYFQNRFGLNHYDFIVSESKYKDEALQLIIKSYNNKNPFHQLFNEYPTYKQEKKAWQRRCNFLCDNGRAIFVINKLNAKLCGGMYLADLCDHIHTDSQVIPHNAYLIQMMNKLHQNIDRHKLHLLLSSDSKNLIRILSNNINTSSELESLYGKYGYGGTTFVANDASRGIFPMLCISMSVMMSLIGYKCVVSDALNINIQKMSVLAGGYIISDLDFTNLRFEDGTCFEYLMRRYEENNGKAKSQKLKRCLAASILLNIPEQDAMIYFNKFGESVKSIKPRKSKL